MNKTAQTFIETANIYATIAAEWSMRAADGYTDGGRVDPKFEAAAFWLMAFRRVEFAHLV